MGNPGRRPAEACSLEQLREHYKSRWIAVEVTEETPGAGITGRA